MAIDPTDPYGMKRLAGALTVGLGVGEFVKIGTDHNNGQYPDDESWVGIGRGKGCFILAARGVAFHTDSHESRCMTPADFVAIPVRHQRVALGLRHLVPALLLHYGDELDGYWRLGGLV